MSAVGADDSGEHERDYRRSGRDCKSVKTSVNRCGGSSDVRGDAPRLVGSEQLCRHRNSVYPRERFPTHHEKMLTCKAQ